MTATFDVRNLTSTGKTLDVSGQMGLTYGFPGEIRFKPDGTKLYLLSSPAILEYTLGTPWDLTTASYASKILDTTPQNDDISAFFIKDDGTKIYIAGADGTPNTILEYTLGTPWDISTATYTAGFDFSAQAAFASCIDFKTDGTVFYIYNNNPSVFYQYTLSSPWDITSASYSGISLATTHTFNGSMNFQADGKRVAGRAQSGPASLYQLDLGTAWNISTAAYEGMNTHYPQGDNVYGMTIKPDGTKVYQVYGNIITEYTTGTVVYAPFNIQGAVSDGHIYDASAQANNISGIYLKSDGTKLVALQAAKAFQYSLGTPWDVSTLSYSGNSFDFTTQEASPEQIYVKADGTKLYLVGDGNTVFEYSFGTPWDLSTLTYTSKSLDVSGQGLGALSVALSDDGTKVYVSIIDHAGGVYVYQYTLSTPFDVSTGTYSGKSQHFLQSIVGVSSQMYFTSDGLKIFFTDVGGGQAGSCVLNSAWDISSVDQTTIVMQEIQLQLDNCATKGITFRPDGLKMFSSVVDSNSGLRYIQGYDITQPGPPPSSGTPFGFIGGPTMVTAGLPIPPIMS